MKKKIYKLVSRDVEVVNDRFLVKVSIVGAAPQPSIMIIIKDLLEDNFKVSFFSNKDAAFNYMKLLQAT